MRHQVLLLLISLFPLLVTGQNWIELDYSIETESDVYYGTAIDFAGNPRDLAMDISYPVDDTPPECGRPLLVFIHGGGFIDGDKGDPGPSRFREEFAQRGYVTASISYRLGQFNTSQFINCNISELGVPWNCLNMADTSEWYRAYYRGIQDANGAIRYLVNHSEDYHIDPNNVFITGESAGGFIAMGAGFIDDISEVRALQIGSMPDVPSPNTLYEEDCVQGFGLDTSIMSMDLARPDLGTWEGNLNFPVNGDYRIRAVGNFYGAVFDNIFRTHGDVPAAPDLYLFHQPNDLIVPYDYNRIFAGYAYCATQFPFNCQYIINRPFVYGSAGIRDIITDMENNGEPVPEIYLDTTTNNAGCAEQILNASTQGHRIDNFALRSGNMAEFFASRVDVCTNTRQADDQQEKYIIYPNPVAIGKDIYVSGIHEKGDIIQIYTLTGELIYIQAIETETDQIVINLAKRERPGVLLLAIHSQAEVYTKKLILAE